MAMILEEILNEIRTLGGYSNDYKPHKHLCLLAAINYATKNNTRLVFYDNYFVNIFSSLFDKYASEDDRNRPYNPFFHLRTSSFWKLVPVRGMESELEEISTIGGPGKLRELVDHVEIKNNLYDLLIKEEDREIIKNTIIEILRMRAKENSVMYERFDYFVNDDKPNNFVSYLNSIHSMDATNENSLAEFQACNPYFLKIHVNHPLVEKIVAMLRSKSQTTIILTGHAGDGKTTISLGVYKELAGLEESVALEKPMKAREDILTEDGGKTTIIKDLSEVQLSERFVIVSEAMRRDTRMLIVSNTGVLLDTLCSFVERYGMGNRAEWEPKILDAMDSETAEIEIDGKNITIINLALEDNLAISRLILERILATENWQTCSGKKCFEKCPIVRNVRLLKENSGLAIDRMFLAYRRMYEYGTRLTLRQLTAHFAYMLTSGLDYEDIKKISSESEEHLMSEYLFYNRFFGDNGKKNDQTAQEMRAIKEIKKQQYGYVLSPVIEKRLWLLKHENNFEIGIENIENEFGFLLKEGSRLISKDKSMSPEQARRQIRRMLFFLHNFKDEKLGEEFILHFLDSKALLKWLRWQNPVNNLSMDESSYMRQRLFRVLQEHFAGIRLPEVDGLGHQTYLYITLSRKVRDLRQSAQVVLAQVDFFRDLQLELKRDAMGRCDLILIGKNGISMTLPLPFLDYVMARHQGELSGTMKTIYANRLDRLKTDLIKNYKEENNNLLLVRLMTDHSFERQYFSVQGKTMEVSNG